MPGDAFGDDSRMWGRTPSGPRQPGPGSRPTGAGPAGPGGSGSGGPGLGGFGRGPGAGGSGSGGAGGFGAGSPAAPTAGTPVVLGPPVLWLGLACACVLAGLVLAALASGRPLVSAAGWAVGGLVAFALLAVFTVVDTRRRADAWYTGRPAAGAAWSGLVVAAVVAVAANAWRFADWASRL